MARNSAGVMRLLRRIEHPLKGLHHSSGGQASQAGAVARKAGGIAEKSGGNRWAGVGPSSAPAGADGNASCFSRSVQEGCKILGFNRGLRGPSADWKCQGGGVASSRLLRSSFFSASKSLGRKGARNSEFNPLRDPSDVGGWRSYFVDANGVRHFRRRGPVAWSELMSSKRSMTWMAVIVVVGGIVYVTQLETVPYTHRKHFVLISPEVEKAIGDQGFKMLLQEYKNKVLPANHPVTVRVHRIAAEIIEALLLGTRASDWGHLEKVGDDLTALGPGWDTATKKSDAPLLRGTYITHSHDDSTDEGWVDESRKEGLRKGEEGFTKHLEGMQWQVLVVDDDIVNAVCLPGGKIIVFTGLLKIFRSDPEVATVIGHEVGHAVARHAAESLTRNIFLVLFQLAVLSVFYVPSLVNSISELLLRLPFSRRMEIEADHIGLILMAAAGYDPRLAPAFYEKLAGIDKAPEFAQYLSTHPSGKKRGEKLRNSATMQEAINLYRQRIAGRAAEGFFIDPLL